MILVQGGGFHMGDSDHSLLKSSRPVHSVTVSSFYISPYQVSIGEWFTVCEGGSKRVHPRYRTEKQPANLPITMVSWRDAVEFCNLLSIRDSLSPCYETKGKKVVCDFLSSGYRLPTEAEWEYAARGGLYSSGLTYAGSSDIDTVGWYKRNSTGCTHKRGRKKPNELGIFDMSGNVWEWCWDWYGAYDPGNRKDPRGPEEGTQRVYRGGSWVDFEYACGVAARGGRTPNRGYDDIGFRVARSC
jgi:formylglycine-generating enzyme required for sulfatase activity